MTKYVKLARGAKVGVIAGCSSLSEIPELRDLLEPLLGKMGTRDHVVMMRLGEGALARLDELVEAGLFGSRSEAAAFLVGAGIQAQKKLFEKIGKQSAEIKKIRQGLRKTAFIALRAAVPGPGSGKEKKQSGRENDRV